jgi:phosphoesterase RecJ-like protein
MFEGESLEKLKQVVSRPQKTAVIAHKNPDGDTIGSALALYFYLVSRGHDVSMMVPNGFPDFYAWMPGIENMLVYEKQPDAVKKNLKDAATVFCLDFNDTGRVGAMSELLQQAGGMKIMIDHHPGPTDEFDLYFSDIAASSTGEIVYELIAGLGDEELITKDVAVSLYTAIMTDTGSFSYSCNNARTYEIVARLISAGVDVSLVHRLVYDTFTENRLRLLGYSLSEKMTVWHNLRVAVIALDKADLQKFDYRIGDTEGLVNYPLSMKDVNVSVLITQREGVFRLSFRSKGDFPVNRVAKEYFDGGGHKNASGGNSYLGLKETMEKLKKVFLRFKNELDYEIKY